MVRNKSYRNTKAKKPRDLILFYSDEGKKLLQVDTGISYDAALDPVLSRHRYVELDELVDDPELPEIEGE